jgi:hypothetical protein
MDAARSRWDGVQARGGDVASLSVNSAVLRPMGGVHDANGNRFMRYRVMISPDVDALDANGAPVFLDIPSP